jgi:3-deoxy-D-manno-octulosonic-acid transferase
LYLLKNNKPSGEREEVNLRSWDGASKLGAARVANEFAPSGIFWRVGWVLWLYRILFPLALLVALPTYLRRALRRGGLRAHFGQRFGGHPRIRRSSRGGPRIWLQAVSVGEMLAIAPLIEALHQDGADIYLTTTTSTGYRIGRDRYLTQVAGIGYFPVDWWPFSVRAWRAIKPDLVILTEGERWPEHLHQAKRRGVPVIAINARLSDRSFRRMKMFGSTARMLVGGVTRLLPSSTQDAARFLELGVPMNSIVTTGNLKFDVVIPRLGENELATLRDELGLPVGLVLLGSSTWPGEEAAMIDALQATRERGLTCSLILVPRHAERRTELERLLVKSGQRFHFRSQGAAAGLVDVAVGDTTGELRKITQLADLVFVGKSLPPHSEGQTPLEAAALGRAIMIGPGMSNFRVIASELIEQGAAVRVGTAAELATTAAGLLRDAGRREVLAKAALAWHAKNAGAVARTLAVVREELAKLPVRRS